MIEQLKITNQRREVKMVVPIAQMHRVVMWLRTHEADFSPIYRPRWINNIYFDTEDFASLTEAIEGDSRRMKVRLRWYGDLTPLDQALLEFKCKVGSVGWKTGGLIERPLDLAHQTWRDIVLRIRRAADDKQRLIFDQVTRPVLINRYHREYFLSFDQSVRVTVDTQMRAWPQTSGMRPNLWRCRPFHGHSVIEFKVPHDERTTVLSDAVHELQGRVTKHSKYVTGLLGLAH